MPTENDPDGAVGTALAADGASTGRTSDGPSRVRDHLANERTYLGWLRTAASVMALGLAVAKFSGSNPTRSLTAGAILIAVGGPWDLPLPPCHRRNQ